MADLDAGNLEGEATTLTVLSDSSLGLEFYGRRHSINTKVYAIKAFITGVMYYQTRPSFSNTEVRV